MKFYSYDYVLSQISQQNGIMIGFGIVLLAITGFFAFKAYRDKKGTKFRELVMILALTLVAMLLVTISFIFTPFHKIILHYKRKRVIFQTIRWGNRPFLV